MAPFSITPFLQYSRENRGIGEREKIDGANRGIGESGKNKRKGQGTRRKVKEADRS